MYPIKLRFWTGCLLTTLVCLPSGFVNQTKVLAVESVVQIAQKSSAYKEYMLRGYQSTMQRNYKRAIGYFQKALEIRPDDRYAKTAIRNVNSYIARRSPPTSFVSTSKPLRRNTAGMRDIDPNVDTFALRPSEEAVQLTTVEHPTFFFYIPESPQNKRKLKFVLQEADDTTTEPLHETTFTPGKKGIVSVSIPKDQPPLKIGKEYTWILIYPFDPHVFPKTINGKIRRVQDETIADQIQQTTQPLDQVLIYTMHGFWENSLSILANLRRQYPDDPDVQQSWTDFLKSVGLDAVANEPLL
jgi:hypothetical protein